MLSDTELRCHVFHKYKRHYDLSYHCQVLFQSLIEMVFSLVTHPILEFLTSPIFVLVLLSLTWSVHRILQPSYRPVSQIYHAVQGKAIIMLQKAFSSLQCFTWPFFPFFMLCHLVPAFSSGLFPYFINEQNNLSF